MTYVVFVLQKLFGYSREKATRLMLQVHNEGKAVVSSGRARRSKPTSPDCTPTACGRPCSRTVDAGGGSGGSRALGAA